VGRWDLKVINGSKPELMNCDVAFHFRTSLPSVQIPFRGQSRLIHCLGVFWLLKPGARIPMHLVLLGESFMIREGSCVFAKELPMTDAKQFEGEIACHHVVFHGRVQGVGFRLTTMQIARRLDVNGYVKNLPNRTVVMVARCHQSVLEELLNAVDTAFAGHIDNREIREGTPNECFDIESHAGFEIRY
jgi:acylphosphatase